MKTIAKIKNFFGVQDMTQGNIMNCLLRFSIPLLIGNLAQQLYNTVDSIIVGKYVGDTALAAVGDASPILNLLLVLFMGISTGATILVSQYFGAKDKEMLDTSVGSTLTLTAICGIVMTVVGYFLSPAMIRMLNTPPDVEAGAIAYLQIIFLGMIGCGFYNIVSGILRGMGDSIYPLLFLLLSTLLNIILDLVFVRNLGLGVAGVAWATIIAQGISGILCIVRLCRMKETVSVNMSTLKPNGMLVKKLAVLGLPSGISQAIFSMSALLTQSLTNSMGTVVMATSVAVMRVDGFCMMPNFTFGSAATTFVGQNVGAKQPERIKKGVNSLSKLAFICAAVMVTAIVLFGHQLLSLFTSTAEVVALGQRMFYWLAVGYLVFSISQVLQGVMRGAGETMWPMWIGMITTVAFRLPVAYILAYFTRSPQWPQGNPDSLFISLMLSWLLGAALSYIVYKKGAWKKKLPQDLRSAL